MLDRGAHSGARHFPCKFPHKIVLVTSPCAFRLRRLAQSVCRGLGPQLVRGILLVNFGKKWLLVKRPIAFRPRRLAQSVVPLSGPGHFSRKIPHRMPLVKRPNASPLRRLAQSVVHGLGPAEFHL